jgi:hypothetical protein
LQLLHAIGRQFFISLEVCWLFCVELGNCLHIPLRKSTLASPTKNEITLRRNWVGRECVSFSLHYRYFVEGNVIFGRKPVPWTDITRSGPLWALIVIHMGHNWGWFILMNYFPFYVIQILRFQVTNNFMWTWIPFFFMWILAIIFACLSDWLIYDNYVNVTTVRKIFTTIGEVQI